MMDIKVAPFNRIRARPGMTGGQLRIWRSQRPGTFAWKNGQTRPGWSQRQGAEWAGVCRKTWNRYENGKTMPTLFIKRLQDYPNTLEEVVDRLFDTPSEQVEEYGGVHPELAHEPGPNMASYR